MGETFISVIMAALAQNSRKRRRSASSDTDEDTPRPEHGHDTRFSSKRRRLLSSQFVFSQSPSRSNASSQGHTDDFETDVHQSASLQPFSNVQVSDLPTPPTITTDTHSSTHHPDLIEHTLPSFPELPPLQFLRTAHPRSDRQNLKSRNLLCDRMISTLEPLIDILDLDNGNPHTIPYVDPHLKNFLLSHRPPGQPSMNHDFSYIETRSEVEKRKKRAMSKMSEGRFAAALSEFTDGTSIMNPSDDVAPLIAKFPTLPQDQAQHRFRKNSDEPCAAIVQPELLSALIKSAKQSAPGLSGMTIMHIKAALRTDRDRQDKLLNLLSRMMNHWSNGRLVSRLLSDVRVIGFTYHDAPGKIRPIGIMESISRLLARYHAKFSWGTAGQDALGSQQFAVGVCNGGALMASVIEDHLHAHSGGLRRVSITMDQENAFNSVYREHIYNELNRIKHPLAKFFRVQYLSRGGTRMVCNGVGVPFVWNRGVVQGDPLAGHYFALAISQSLLAVPESRAYADDITITADHEVVAGIVAGLQIELNKIGLTTNLSKTAGARGLSSEAPDSISILGSPVDIKTNTDLLGIPLGEDDHKLTFVKNKIAEVIRIANVLSNTLPTQHFLLLMRFCVQTKLSYLMRTVPFTQSIADAFKFYDMEMDNIIAAKIGASALPQAAGLPVRYGGIGIRSLARTLPAALAGGYRQRIENWSKYSFGSSPDGLPPDSEAMRLALSLPHIPVESSPLALHTQGNTMPHVTPERNYTWPTDLDALDEFLVKGTQKELQLLLDKALLKHLKEDPLSDVSIALGSATAPVACSLFSNPSQPCLIVPDASFNAAIRRRLAIPATAQHTTCPLCNRNITTDPDHAQTCTKMAGQHTQTHNAVRNVLATASSSAGNVVLVEPKLVAKDPTKTKTKIRGDVHVYDGNHTNLLIDCSCVSEFGATARARGKLDGGKLDRVEKKKREYANAKTFIDAGGQKEIFYVFDTIGKVVGGGEELFTLLSSSAGDNGRCAFDKHFWNKRLACTLAKHFYYCQSAYALKCTAVLRGLMDPDGSDSQAAQVYFYRSPASAARDLTHTATGLRTEAQLCVTQASQDAREARQLASATDRSNLANTQLNTQSTTSGSN